MSTLIFFHCLSYLQSSSPAPHTMLSTVEDLLSQKQYKSAELLCSFLLPTLSSSSEELTRLQILMGECLYEQEEYYRALLIFQKADLAVELGPVDETFVHLSYYIAKVRCSSFAKNMPVK